MLLKHFCRKRIAHPDGSRRGSFLPLGVAGMLVTFTFVSFAVDLGMISITRERMQNTCDAAALAAAQDITLSVREAGEGYTGDGEVDPIQVSEQRAREVAVKVGELNGVHIAESDVEFGKRVLNEEGNLEVQWGATPYNVVRVKARKEKDDMNAPDAKLKLFFAGVFGEDKVTLRTTATAFVEARDLAMVLDFSASMNDDSEVVSYDDLGEDQVLDNQREIYDALNLDDGDLEFDPQFYTQEGVDPTSASMPKIYVTFKNREIFATSSKDLSNVVLMFTDGSSQKFDNLNIGQSGTFKGTGGYSGRRIAAAFVKSGSNGGPGSGNGERFDITVDRVKAHFGLTNLDFPNDAGSWNEYINYVMGNRNAGIDGFYIDEVENSGVAYEFGGPTLVNYLIRRYTEAHNSPNLWKAPAQPVTALKNGVKLFTEYLEELRFSDYVGVVTYADAATLEMTASDPDLNIDVDITNNPLTNRYNDIYQLVRFKQAGHYSRNTGMGYGIERGIQLLEDEARTGTRKTLLIMTDGIANRAPNGFSLPQGWNWNKLTDYDKDGIADYQTNDKNKQHAFYQVKRAIDKGYTVHAITIGQGADDALLRAIAHAGGGVWMDVPGGSTIAELEEQMRAAFAQIALHVPPPKLINVD